MFTCKAVFYVVFQIGHLLGLFWCKTCRINLTKCGLKVLYLVNENTVNCPKDSQRQMTHSVWVISLCFRVLTLKAAVYIEKLLCRFGYSMLDVVSNSLFLSFSLLRSLKTPCGTSQT